MSEEIIVNDHPNDFYVWVLFESIWEIHTSVLIVDRNGR